jgi:hypothetical protein
MNSEVHGRPIFVQEYSLADSIVDDAPCITGVAVATLQLVFFDLVTFRVEALDWISSWSRGDQVFVEIISIFRSNH